MKIFFDTEFTGLHRNTTLISIGCVDEVGRTFYAEFCDYDRNQCDDWIKNNVIANLKYVKFPVNPDHRVHVYTLQDGSVEVYGTKSAVAQALKTWLNKYDSVQLVSDVCHYDMMLFIDLFGGAFDLPPQINPACHDINQDIAKYFRISEKEAFDKCREDILIHPISGDKHNSLYDAKVIRAIYYLIRITGTM